jgi:hypothetical protein
MANRSVNSGGVFEPATAYAMGIYLIARKRRESHTGKADRMARHIEESAKKEGRYKGREKAVAWATVHKEDPRSGHKESSTRRRSR